MERDSLNAYYHMVVWCTGIQPSVALLKDLIQFLLSAYSIPINLCKKSFDDELVTDSGKRDQGFNGVTLYQQSCENRAMVLSTMKGGHTRGMWIQKM